MKALSVLVAIPEHDTLPPVLWQRMRALSDRLQADNPTVRLDLGRPLNAERLAPGEDYFAPHARARNALLAQFLRPRHDAVLWIDADLTGYPADLPTRLAALWTPGTVVAPLPLIEGTERLYDTWGFVLPDGSRASPEAPWFGPPPARWPRVLVELAAVGCCYLIDAAIYRSGVQYAPTPGHTEHWSVMQAADLVLCAPDLRVYHADLPRYGVAWHQARPVGAG